MDMKRHGTIVGQGYREVAKFPLPNISNEMLDAEDPEIKYSTAARTLRKNMPVTPPWLSLHPQSELDRFKAEAQHKPENNDFAEYRTYVETLQSSADGSFYCDKCAKAFRKQSGLVQHTRSKFHVRQR